MDCSYHIPVLGEETIALLNVHEGGVYFDGTLGGGGHSEMILSRTKTAEVIATDKDSEAIEYASARLAPFGNRVKIFHTDFKQVKDILGDTELDGAVLDLGISSRQIDSAQRGFSYIKDAPLDMRMNRDQDFSALDVVNGYSEEELKKIFFEYGEERNSKRIAAAITASRTLKKIESTAQLAQIIASAAHFDPRAGHPAKRVFQALRIEVNEELANLDRAIKFLAGRLKIGGRICVISFHSLEDRIVKQTLKFLEADCLCPPKMPICTCGKKREVKILTNKPVTAGVQELKDNPRAASAKLRAAERI